MDGQRLETGSFLVEDVNLPELLSVAERGSVQVGPMPEGIPTTPGIDLAKISSLLIIGPGGFGDCILITPVLAALRKQFPLLTIGFAVRERSQPIFDGLHLVDKFESYPTPLETVARYDAVTLMENHNEVGEAAKTKHAIHNKAARVGIEVEDMTCLYLVAPEERVWAKEKYPSDGRVRIGVQLAASAEARSYPPNRLFAAITPLMRDHGWLVLTLGTPGSTDKYELAPHVKPHLIDLPRDRLTARESIAVMTTCDIILAPDSFASHISGVLGIPCLALFGPIAWQLRTSHYPSVTAIQGYEGCDLAPCFWHQHSHRKWPVGGPCNEKGYCVPLAAIPPEKITAKLIKMHEENSK